MFQKSSVIIGLTLFLLSSFPLFLMARETMINSNILNRYELSTARMEFGYDFSLDSPITSINGYTIEIKETPTGRKEELEPHEIESGEIPRDIVMAKITVDGEEIGEPYEVMLGARSDHTRYHNYVEILTVKEGEKERVAIIVTKEMYTIGSAGMWDIIWLDGDTVSIETFKRSESGNHLAARMINYGGLTEMSFGYYSDINHYYPTLVMPILYPFGTAIVGVLLFIFGVFKHLLEKRKHTISRSKEL